MKAPFKTNSQSSNKNVQVSTAYTSPSANIGNTKIFAAPARRPIAAAPSPRLDSSPLVAAVDKSTDSIVHAAPRRMTAEYLTVSQGRGIRPVRVPALPFGFDSTKLQYVYVEDFPKEVNFIREKSGEDDNQQTGDTNEMKNKKSKSKSETGSRAKTAGKTTGMGKMQFVDDALLSGKFTKLEIVDLVLKEFKGTPEKTARNTVMWCATTMMKRHSKKSKHKEPAAPAKPAPAKSKAPAKKKSTKAPSRKPKPAAAESPAAETSNPEATI